MYPSTYELATVQARPPAHENRVEVSITPPHMWVNLTPFELEGLAKKCRLSLSQRLRATRKVLRSSTVAALVVDGVVPTPQDPVVGAQPVVVELVAEVAQIPCRPFHPIDVHLLVAQRFGHEYVVPDRDDE